MEIQQGRKTMELYVCHSFSRVRLRVVFIMCAHSCFLLNCSCHNPDLLFSKKMGVLCRTITQHCLKYITKAICVAG